MPHTWPLTLTTTIRLEHPLCPDHPFPSPYRPTRPRPPVPITLQTDTHAGHAQATVSHAPSGSSTKKMRGNADHTCRQNQGIPEVPGRCSLTRTLWPKHAHRTDPRLVPTCPEAGR